MSEGNRRMQPMHPDDHAMFEAIIRADERASEAHRRLDRMDELIGEIGARIGAVERAVNKANIQLAQLNVKVGLAAAVGSLVGGGIIAALVSVLAKA